MAKSLPTGYQTALDSSHVSAVMFVECQFNPTPAYFCTAGHTMTWGGHDWVGLGSILSVAQVEEGEGLEAFGVEVQLTGVPSALVSLALQEHVQGKRLLLYLGLLNTDGAGGWVGGANPTLEWSGFIDRMAIQDSGEASIIVLTAESKLASLLGNGVRRYTNEDQQQMFGADDLGMEYVAQMAQKTLIFPSAAYLKAHR